MTLLVAGNQRVDAGKTTFSVGLVARTGAVGPGRIAVAYEPAYDDLLSVARWT